MPLLNLRVPQPLDQEDRQTKTMSMIFVAPRATEIPSPSHYFSFYSRVFSIRKFEGKKILIITSAKLNKSKIEANYEYILTSRYTRDNFSGPKTLNSFKSDCQRLLKFYNSESEIHFYDGNFREFLLLLRLCIEETNCLGSFNFQNANEWQVLLKSKKLSARMIRKCMRIALSHVSTIKFFAESGNLSSLVNQALAIESSVFPLATNLPHKIASKNIKYDVLFMPQSQDEVNECTEIARKLKRSSKFSLLKVAIRMSSSLDVDSKNGAEHVVLIRGHLNINKYIEMLSSSKVVVFPYFNNFYEWGSSGKYLDAVYLKTVTVVPENSRMSLEGLEYGYTFSYVNFSFEEISNLISKALNYASTGREVGVRDFEEMVKTLTLNARLKSNHRTHSSGFRLSAFFWLLSIVYIFYISENQSKKAIVLSFLYNRARQVFRSVKKLIRIFSLTK
jgi:hypothetical protein